MKHPKDIHVVYIITKLELGGAQKICLALFNELQKEGISTHLIAGHDGPLVSAVKHSKQVILLEQFKREVSWHSLWQEVRTFLSIIRALRKLKKEYAHLIVHTHSTKAGIIGRWAAWAARIKIRIHTIHGYAFHNHLHWCHWFPIYFLELITSFITTHFVCVSSQDVKTGIRFFPYFAQKHSIIRAAVDWNTFYIPAQLSLSYPASGIPFIFGTIACFKPQKNIFDLLRAFKMVYQKNNLSKLEIIGDGILRNDIQQWISINNLSHVITLHGWQEQVAPLMIKWHAFTLSSLWEGLPCAIIEARLLRLPVICYQVGGISDVIINQENGIIVNEKNWTALGNAMLFAQQPSVYQNMRAYQEDLSDFTIPYMTTQHKELYEQFKI